jgi:hypothetical protein
LHGHLAAAAQAAEGHRGAERGFACPTQHSHEKDVGHRHRNATRRNGCAGAEGIKENTNEHPTALNAHTAERERKPEREIAVRTVITSATIRKDSVVLKHLA